MATSKLEIYQRAVLHCKQTPVTSLGENNEARRLCDVHYEPMLQSLMEAGFDVPDDARAIGLTDWDQDGDWDLWVANRNGPQLRFFQNNSEHDFASNQFLGLPLGLVVGRRRSGAGPEEAQ